MCGIFAIFLKKYEHYEGAQWSSMVESKNGRKRRISLRELAHQESSKQKHRGPDYTGLYVIQEDGVALVHERLSILGVKTGSQPLLSEDGNISLIANGEIYNYLELAAKLNHKRNGDSKSGDIPSYKPRSDSDLIIGLYEEYGLELLFQISGMFAFILYDRVKKTLLVARDPIGIIPLYKGLDRDGNLYFASEMKCLVDRCNIIENFPPGQYCYGTRDDLKFNSFYNPNWMSIVPKVSVDYKLLNQKLSAAVRSHLQCEVSFGALLSGGVDSSLIASIATKVLREKDPYYKLKTYSVGLQGAPDFKYSQMVADFIDSDHTEVYFTVQEGLDCIRDIIYHLESYDITTIRASIPMFLLSRFIKSEGLKVVLSGEGADEIFGGYLYFHSAPNPQDFHMETVSRVQNLHLSDCLRANKSTMSWGLELRVPFLDKDFVNYSMSIRPEERQPQKCSSKKHIEKYILRKAFAADIDNYEYLPDEVLWRQKEQFSDGVGYSWIDTIRSYASSHIADEEFENVSKIFPFNTPSTKEAYYYRQIFEEIFPHKTCATTVMAWIPRTDWGCSADPSGRAQSMHIAHA